ncbi:MAG: SDR family NAD(P)-dependent oxidoreductase [Pseudomonadota bacterium]
MTKTVLLTGGTDGIGLETAKLLVAEGHKLLLHGRSESKLSQAKEELSTIARGDAVQTYRADLSILSEVKALAADVKRDHPQIDVLINNAGVFKVPNTTTGGGYDVRFIVNMVAPYLLTQELSSLFHEDSRVVNLSSAAQAPVDVNAFVDRQPLADSDAYAQSKLGITMWSFHLARSLGEAGPSFIAVNPASFLGSKMVKDAYGTSGNDLSIGADILFRAALSDEFAGSSGRYYDNDRRQFADPHPDALDPDGNAALVTAIEQVISELGG